LSLARNGAVATALLLWHVAVAQSRATPIPLVDSTTERIAVAVVLRNGALIRALGRAYASPDWRFPHRRRFVQQPRTNAGARRESMARQRTPAPRPKRARPRRQSRRSLVKRAAVPTPSSRVGRGSYASARSPKRAETGGAASGRTNNRNDATRCLRRDRRANPARWWPSAPISTDPASSATRRALPVARGFDTADTVRLLFQERERAVHRDGLDGADTAVVGVIEEPQQ